MNFGNAVNYLDFKQYIVLYLLYCILFSIFIKRRFRWARKLHDCERDRRL